jgi:hypothetical protein
MMSQEKSRKFEITHREGAIVFRDTGIEFHYPENGSIELRETFEFLMFAMIKQEWIAEWYEYLNTAEALADLAGKEDKVPHLTVIKGGKCDEE